MWSRPTLLATDVADAPDLAELKPGMLFREVRGSYPKWVHFMCPRCKEHIQLPLAGKAHWAISIDLLRRPTISPSVWQTGSCQAHFFVRRGLIEWCPDSRSAQRHDRYV